MKWSQAKVGGFVKAFRSFVAAVRVDSKEGGGEAKIDLWQSQLRFIKTIADGLLAGVHDFTFLKARQLGLSTITFLLTIFWCATFRGIQAAIVFDEDKNRAKFHQLLLRAIKSLPKSHRVTLTINNMRTGIAFSNGSSIDYLTAGTRVTKTSGGLGASRAYNYIHLTEVARYGDPDGLKSLDRSFAKQFPLRLKINESTARGFNHFADMCDEAKADDLAQRFCFIGWYMNETNRFERGSELFKRYAAAPVTEEEQGKINEVEKRYGFLVSIEQLAWYRHETDPNAEREIDKELDGALQQDLPWTEEEAFVLTGSKFFEAGMLTTMIRAARLMPWAGYRYHMTQDFFETKVEPTKNRAEAVLKIWEEPVEGAVYVIGADPAFGYSATADRYVAQICRCYADGLDQVGEFCAVKMATYQFAWVLAHLCGVYAGVTGRVRLLMEINGPGEAVLNAFRELRLLLEAGYLAPIATERGLTNIFSGVSNYYYRRIDSLNGGAMLQWRTTTALKAAILNQTRDDMLQGQLRVRSVPCLEEAKFIVQDGDSIAAEGKKKDDRIIGLALADRAWHDNERVAMIGANRTREAEQRSGQLSDDDIRELFFGNIVSRMFEQQAQQRREAARAERERGRWRWR